MWHLIVSVPDHCLSFYFVTFYNRLFINLYTYLVENSWFVKLFVVKYNLYQGCVPL